MSPQTFDATKSSAAVIAAAVRDGRTTARKATDDTLALIARVDPKLHAFTNVLAAEARASADAVDARRARGEKLGALAGVPFAVKNLFDVAGLPTLAGSLINRSNAPASADATLIAKLKAQDAILLGALNMGEYAYDFTGENVHYGNSLNPHATGHMSGGSSGGSGTAVASGMAAIALGSDTNGSIRVPASLCGLFGLKPTYGRLSRAGTFPFVASFDHLGPLARSVEDLALCYDAMQGPDALDHAQAARAIEPASSAIDAGVDGLRIAVAGGYFATGAMPEALEAVQQVAKALDTKSAIEIPEAHRARAAAYVITTVEGAALHAERLRTRAKDFDPEVRNRLIAGAMFPAGVVVKAQKFRRWYREAVLRLFENVDVILAPATPCRAPRTGQKNFLLNGVEMPVRANLGIFTQPISFIGLPVVSVPVWTDGEPLPIGVQIICAPWREDIALRVARELELSGVVKAPVAQV